METEDGSHKAQKKNALQQFDVMGQLLNKIGKEQNIKSTLKLKE